MPLNVQKVKWGHMIRPAWEGRVDAPARDLGADEVFAAWVLGPAARVPAMSTRMGLQAVLFDLDGVLVDTAEFHYQAWLRLSRELGLPFDRQMNHSFRGVGRMECLEKLLGEHTGSFVKEEKHLLADRKNTYYLEMVATLTPQDLAVGARGLAMGLRALSEGGARLAVVSASRNCRTVLRLLQIEDWFDVVVDGSDVARGKPDPQGFLLAAERLRVKEQQCVVVEDADAGLKAARAAHMGCVGVGNGVGECDVHVQEIGELTIEQMEKVAARNVERMARRAKHRVER